jgi:hypothetical protein
MKNSLIIAVLFLSVLTKAQDNPYCYNGGNITSPSETANETVLPALEQKSSLILMPYVMNEKQVVGMLKEKNNSSINSLLRKVKLSKDFETLSIAAVPETLLGASFLGIVSATGNGNQSGQQKQIAVGLLAASAICLTSSLCFKVIHKKNYKKAIAKYNQLYN